MNPTSEVLKRISRSSKDHPDGVFTRLYRYLLREDVYYAAYKNLYANQGAATKGIDNDTADGFGSEYIAKTIEQLKTLQYQPQPVRRTYIPKKNGGKRPLGIPSFRDKLVQDVIRQILESIYEPVFSEWSHGFRPDRSCHTALRQVKYGYNGIRWFVEGDIKGCFDNINHQKLLDILSRRVKDSRLINLIRAFLKAGYMEDWKYERTYSGTPQGGILSPILANIYLHELDCKVNEMKAQYDKAMGRTVTDVQRKAKNEIGRWHKLLIKHPDAPERAEWIANKQKCQKLARTLPCKDAIDKKLCYVRYADDFLIGVSGSKEDCIVLKAQLKAFLAEELGLELSEEKTKITHSSEPARFLGYDITVRRTNQLKRRKDGVVQRSLNNTVCLAIPFKDKIEPFLLEKGYGIRLPDGKLQPTSCRKLLQNSDLEIVSMYNAQVRGLCNYYRMASNFGKLKYFVYIMEYSCLKTLAGKHQTTMAQARACRRYGKRWGVRYETKAGTKMLTFVIHSDFQRNRMGDESLDIMPRTFLGRNELESRLKASVCELCGTTLGPFEIHHINKLKNLRGKEAWEFAMISRRRKTLVVCKPCHHDIHHN